MAGSPNRHQNHHFPRLHLEPRLFRPPLHTPLPRRAQARLRHRDHSRRRRGGPHQMSRTNLRLFLHSLRCIPARSRNEPHRQPRRPKQELRPIRRLGRTNPRHPTLRANRKPRSRRLRRTNLDTQHRHRAARPRNQRRELYPLLGIQKQHPRLLSRAHRRLARRHAAFPHV